MASPFSKTFDGLEMQFGVNHVGHHLLTSLLMPTLVAAGTPFAPSRVVNVSSLGHYLFPNADHPIDFEELAEPREDTYKEWSRYGALAACGDCCAGPIGNPWLPSCRFLARMLTLRRRALAIQVNRS